MDDLLAGLQSVDWEAYQDAYGPAREVPGLLQLLIDGSPEEREEALFDLHGNIWHQGTTYEVTAHAVPFLACIATHDDSLRPPLLLLLSLIATGQPMEHYPEGTDAQKKLAAQHSQAAREAVGAQLPTLARVVEASPTRASITALARLAFSFPEKKDCWEKVLVECFYGELVEAGEQSAIALAFLRADAQGARMMGEDAIENVWSVAMDEEAADDPS